MTNQGDFMTNSIKPRQNEQGNALFLILIAVVLFAALSYAITQSNRSSGNAGRETNTISGTTLTQYTSGIRTGITRMLLRGTATSELLFDKPSDGNYNSADPAVRARQVFHPDGGGVGYQATDQNLVNGVIAETASAYPGSATQFGNWHFILDKPVQNIATNSGEVVAILEDVKKGVCEQLNQQINGNTNIPISTSADAAMIDNTLLTGTGIDGQPFGCVKSTGTKYYYYHVLAEQ